MQDVKTKVSFSHDYDEERGFHIATIHVEGRLGKLAKLLDDLNSESSHATSRAVRSRR